MSAPVWTDAMMAVLIAGLRDGLTFAQIVGTIRIKTSAIVTRSAAIGRAHRSGLSTPKVKGAAKLTEARQRPKAAPVVEPVAAIKAAAGTPSACVVVVTPVPPRDGWHGANAVLALSARGCKWPLGDPGRPGFTFCGEPRAEGRPYCEAHRQQGVLPKQPQAIRVPFSGQRPGGMRSQGFSAIGLSQKGAFR